MPRRIDLNICKSACERAFAWNGHYANRYIHSFIHICRVEKVLDFTENLGFPNYRFVISFAESESVAFYVPNNHAIQKWLTWKSEKIVFKVRRNEARKQNGGWRTRLSADVKENFSGQESLKCRPLTVSHWDSRILTWGTILQNRTLIRVKCPHFRSHVWCNFRKCAIEH
jgi:hypothetical protein